MVWIGDRTRQLNGAHVEFCKGISNPIGIKVGPTAKPSEIKELVKTINPHNEKGKIVLIVRMGAQKINQLFPTLLRQFKNSGLNVVWSCDPMHANIEKSKSGYKTRNFKNILAEVKSFFKIHKEIGTYAGGIHLEMTGQNVTECIGGLQKISDKDLSSRYHTHCDPRLNASQSIELAFLMASNLKKELRILRREAIKFFLLQKSSKVGDFDINFKVIKNAFKKACLNECDFLITSELFLTGYPPQDLINRIDFHEKIDFFKNKILKITEKKNNLDVKYSSKAKRENL